jgi:hypothetical protein
MIETATTPGPDQTTRHSARLRQLGSAVLFAGIVAAGIVYWFGSRPRDLSDSAMIGYYKPQTRQMGMLYGQMGVMMDDLLAALKRPGVQAVLILGACGIFCLVCFHLARPREVEEPSQTGSPTT